SYIFTLSLHDALPIWISISVFFLILYYNFKVKGPGGLGKELLTKPFGAYFFPVNIAFRILEEGVRPFSLSLRLFGNLFAGELVLDRKSTRLNSSHLVI